MGLNWRKSAVEKPADGQACLTKMKHGIIQGNYDAEEDCWGEYYWRDMEWDADEWVPIEEV